jgi:hypothetical protein
MGAMAPQKQALQLIIVPHRPVHTDEEINNDLEPAFKILQKWERNATIC